jgi:hypothetical protein
MPPPVSPSDNRPYNDRLASILRKDPGYLTRAAWTPRELTDQFSWLPGAWNYTMLISKNGSAIQLVLPGEEPMPYIIWDGFNGQFVLSMLTPRSFGSMISKGFRGDKLVFEGIMTFVGLSLNLRQTWTRQPAKGTFAIANEEALPNGKFAAVDEFAFVKA